MITGKAGSVNVKYVERRYMSKKPSVSIREIANRELKIAVRSINKSVEAGSRSLQASRIIEKKGRTPSERKNAVLRSRLILDRMEMLQERRKKINSFARAMKIRLG